MLQELSIQNFAIIPQLNLSFHEGMTALTGETGAGKSIIIDAVGLLTGGRGSTDFIRQGANKAVLEGLFDKPKSIELTILLESLGIDAQEDSLLMQRDLLASGKNVCRVNGRMVNTSALRQIGEFLVDIHGQNEHQELMNEERHLNMLDEFGGLELKEIKSAYQASFQTFQKSLSIYKKRMKNEKEFAQRVDMLGFQIKEIEEADLSIGEEEQLQKERNRLANFQKVSKNLSDAYEALASETDSSLDRIGVAMSSMEAIEELDKEYANILDTISNAFDLLQDAASNIDRQRDLMDMDEDRLDEIETRLELITQLKRKYGETIEDILEYYQEISEELADSKDQGESLEEIETKTKQLRKIAWENGLKLREMRQAFAVELIKEIQNELKGLYMDKTQFDVRFNEYERFHLAEEGIENCEFYITSNPGEPLKPLVKVASGGEMSRVMLALKTIFAKSAGITSIVFDEVDTGVSGRVAQAIADKIHKISTNSQVLCITHLPQVAASADYQYLIEKEVVAGRTQTNVSELQEIDRVREIARMLSGEQITGLALEHARELLYRR
ncbi:MAG: DNA repair protein RecN [Streptococcaceae bacterium]|jgi:DNA repair protein RecN (Recombination protein N)|nr:DNA repair protein RecN [Streptococcaceae bacterium]